MEIFETYDYDSDGVLKHDEVQILLDNLVELGTSGRREA